MANFNKEIFNIDALSDRDMSHIGVVLESLLPAEQFEQLKEDWRAAGGYEVIPLWKYALNEIQVSYSKKE